MKRVVADSETNGFLPELTTIHSLVLRDLDSDTVVSCADQPGYVPIEEGLALLSAAERIYGHNFIEFDVPALKKVYPRWTYSGEIRDTLIMARTRWGHIRDLDMADIARGRLVMPGDLIGSHKLKAWGYRLGVLKGDYGETSDWSKWEPAMQVYCEGDTASGKALVEHIRLNGGLPQAVIEVEHALAWYLRQQERNGFPFDKDAAERLQAKLAGRREELAQALREQFGSWEVNNGKPFVAKRDNKRLGYVAGETYQKRKMVEFNPSSRDHIAFRLQQDFGWTPEEFTPSGKPKVDDDTLAGLKLPGTEQLVEYLMVDKRLGLLAEGKEGWLRVAKQNPTTGLHHIHGRVNQNGAITHRSTHSSPNISQVPKVGKPYGTECRSLFHVPDGWLQMGADMSGLELRCLAHFLARYDGGEYTKLLLEGDVHAVTREALEPFGVPQDKAGRDIAKTWVYGYLYGAGDQKAGSIIAPSASPTKQKRIGAASKRNFESRLAAVGYLQGALKHAYKSKGYVVLIDGRRAYVRHAHAVLNTLLQGTGAVLSKHWIVRYDEAMQVHYGPQGWDGKWAALSWSHDEIQTAVRPDVAEHAAKVAVESIEYLTDKFAFRCPLTGESKIGTNWATTH